MGRIGAVNLNNNILYRSEIIMGEIIFNIIFYSVCVWVSYQLNKSLHKDIFPPREWKFISEVDGQEYTIIEDKKW